MTEQMMCEGACPSHRLFLTSLDMVLAHPRWQIVAVALYVVASCRWIIKSGPYQCRTQACAGHAVLKCVHVGQMQRGLRTLKQCCIRLAFCRGNAAWTAQSSPTPHSSLLVRGRVTGSRRCRWVGAVGRLPS